jgi:hypothetical protein
MTVAAKKPTAVTATKYEKSTLKFSEATKIVEAGNLNERTAEVLLEVKGVLNKVATKVKDQEREVDKALNEKAKTAPAGTIKQLDFDSITMSGEFIEEDAYTLTLPMKKFLSEAAAVGQHDMFVTTKAEKKSIFKAYEAGTLHPSLRKHITKSTKSSFLVERVKK